MFPALNFKDRWEGRKEFSADFYYNTDITQLTESIAIKSQMGVFYQNISNLLQIVFLQRLASQ